MTGAAGRVKRLGPYPTPRCRDVAEEQRVHAVWEAPWPLLVMDDSVEGSLEYANKRVGLGAGF